MAKNDNYSYITNKTNEELRAFIDIADIDLHELDLAKKELDRRSMEGCEMRS